MNYLSALLVLFGISILPGIAGAASVKINFDDPENFSDLEYEGYYSEDLLERFEKAVRDALKPEVSENLPKGDQLQVTFLDIDLAGEYEPWRINSTDVRIMRDIYPPRLKFEYRVRNADDEVVAQGTAQLTDLNYLWNVPQTLWNSDTFYHERELLEDWASRKLPMLVKNGEGVPNN